MKTITPNAPLLRRTLAWIEEHPERLNQTIYRCGSAMCFAGWAAELAGGRWARESNHPLGSYLHAVQGDDPTEVVFMGGRRIIHASSRARRVLGLTEAQARRLFDPSNDLPGLRSMVGDLCEARS